MNDKVFFDTNILVYAFGVRRASLPDARTEIAEQLLALGGVLSVQVLNEFVQVCRRKADLSWEQITGALEVVKELCGRVLPMTLDTHEAALDLSQRYGYSIYDSLILAAAMEAGCSIVYSEDMQSGQTLGNLTVINPFLEK
jgi:predicted nucleic acid-binding protein